MPFLPKNAAIWSEIPVWDFDAGCAFYSAVFDIELQVTKGGPNPMAIFPTEDPATGIGGNIYPGKPYSTGMTIQMPVPDTLAASSDRCTSAGGTLVGDPVDIPAGRFQYIRDPYDNSIGLFEPKS